MKANFCADNSVNIFIGNAHCPALLEAMFLSGPDDKDPVNFMPENSGIEDVAVEIGFMTSKGQAKKNGFSGEIPEGLHEFIWGKNKIRVYTYRPPEKTAKLVARAKSIYGGKNGKPT